jgi:hypothetical protein
VETKEYNPPPFFHAAEPRCGRTETRFRNCGKAMMRERKGRRPRWRKKGDGEANRKRCDGDERKAEGNYALLLYAL